MPLSMGEKIKVILKRRNMTVTELSENLNTSRQNLTNKFARDNFSEKELIQIAQVLDCTFKTEFVMNDTGESI